LISVENKSAKNYSETLATKGFHYRIKRNRVDL
jgi:hypothetical protein